MEIRAGFVQRMVQPALLGLMDGAVSTLAPIFAAAELTGESRPAFIVGIATSLGAGISMGLAEGLSDDGTVTGRGNPLLRGTITGVATGAGGMLHTLPFLLDSLSTALVMAVIVVVVELIAIAYVRFHYMGSPLGRTFAQVFLGGMLVFLTGLWLGRLGGAG